MTKPFAERSMTARQNFRGAVSDPPQTVTNAERLQLLRDMANRKPEPQRQFTPKGPMRAWVDQSHDQYKKRRIAHIETRLMVANYGFNRDQQKAFNKHRAKVGFNKANAPDIPKPHESNQQRLDKLRAQRGGQARTEFNHTAATKMPQRSR